MVDFFLLKEDGGALLKEDGARLILDGVDVAVTFPTLPPTLESVLAGHHTPVARLQFLDDDLETVLHEVVALPTEAAYEDLLGGQVSYDRTRDTHVSADVSLVNTAGLYSPRTSADLVWPNRPVRLARGALVGSVPQFATLMTGIIEEPAEAEASGRVQMSISSRLEIANRQFPTPLTLPAGLRVQDAMRTLAEVGGLGTTDAWYDLADGGLTLAEARTYDVTATVLREMMALAFDSGCDLYDDADGHLVMLPFPDPAGLPTAWTFEAGAAAVHTGITRAIRALQVYNRVVVIGTAPDRYPIRAEARVTNPADPLYWTPEFDLVAPPYVSSNITTQAQANATAARLLLEAALYEERVASEGVPIPLLRDRAVVRLHGDLIDDRYLIDRFTIPLGPGRQTIASRKVRSLLA